MENLKSIAQVNIEKSQEVGLAINNYKVREEFLSRPFLTIETDQELKLRAIFYAVAICHQTYNLAMPERNLFGWDVIEFVFHRTMEEKTTLLQPGFVAHKSSTEIATLLHKEFSSTTDPASCTLDRLEERANLLIDFDRKMEHCHSGSLMVLLQKSASLLFSNGNGLYELLEEFEAFTDPMRKKSSFLIKLLEDAKLFSMADQENYIPIMDYHMQRVLLRSGCVEVLDKEYAHRLKAHLPVLSDVELREACIESMRIIANESGHSIAAMNDFFWPLGRSCCNETPMCQTGKCEKSPCSLTQLITLDHPHPACILKDVCTGRNSESHRRFWQPVVETHYY